MLRILLLIILLFSFSYCDDEAKIIRSGNGYLIVKNREKIDKLLLENKKLKKELENLKRKNIELENKNIALKNCNNNYLILKKIIPSTFVLIKDCSVENIDKVRLKIFKKGEKFTSFLEDNKNRYKISGLFKKGKWYETNFDFWIDKECVRKIK